MRQREIDGFIRNLTPKTSVEPANLQHEYSQEARTLESDRTHTWQSKIDNAGSQKASFQERIQSDVPTQGGLFERSHNLERLDTVKEESFGGFNPQGPNREAKTAELMGRFQSIEQRAHEVKPKEYDEENNPVGGDFADRKNQFAEKVKPNFLLKVPQHSILWKAAVKAGELFGFPVQKMDKSGNHSPDKPYDPGILGWDSLNDEEKILVMDSRTSDYFP